VDTLYGRDEIKLQAATPGDKVIKLANAGIPRLRGAGRGDLYLHLRVDIPAKLDGATRDLVRQLGEALAGPGDKDAPSEGEEGFFSKLLGGPDKDAKKKKKK
jgi:molecular chaperone DnaJ